MFTRRSSAGPAPNSAPVSPVSSLCQARLDAIVTVSPIYYQKYLEWTRMISDAPQNYTPAVLKARAEELGPRIALLKRELMAPDLEMTAPAWKVEHERLLRLQAQMRAVEEAQERYVRSQWKPKEPPREEPTPALPEWDPFAE